MLQWTKQVNRDGVGDGYDANIPYQMVPRGEARFMTLETGPFPVEMTVGAGVSCGLTNFRGIRPFGSTVPGLPDSSRATQKVTIPANIEVQFDIGSGVVPGHGILEVRQLQGGRPSPRPELAMILSVKARTSRNFLVCHVFDAVNIDTGVRPSIDLALQTAKRVFAEQSNILILTSGDPVTVTMRGSMGTTFDPLGKPLVRRLLTATRKQHGANVFDRHTAVIFMLPVPVVLVDGKGESSSLLGVAVPYEMDGKAFETILVSAGTASRQLQLGHTLAHEIGHVMNLEHLPETEAEVFPKGMPAAEKQAKFQEFRIRNLMFPTNFVQSNRLNGFQIERIFVPRDRGRITV
jgi:hypothetical protein